MALKLLLEVALISVGVFLGLLGEQWRENAHQHDLAKDSLRRFHAEIVENRDAVAKVVDYHAIVQEIQAALQKGSSIRRAREFISVAFSQCTSIAPRGSLRSRPSR
jgi:hypothetical protein